MEGTELALQAQGQTQGQPHGQPQSQSQSMPQGGTQSHSQRNGPREESLPLVASESRMVEYDPHGGEQQFGEYGQGPAQTTDRGRQGGLPLPDLTSTEPIFLRFRRYVDGQHLDPQPRPSRREDRNSPVRYRSQGRTPEAYTIYSLLGEPHRENEAPR